MLNDMTKDLDWSYGRRQYHDCWWGGQVVEWDPGPLMRERIVPRKGFLSFPDFSIEITNGRLIWEHGVLYRGVWGEGGGGRNEKEWERAQGSEKTEKGSEKIYNRESEFVAGAKKWWEKAIKTPAFPLAAPWLRLEGAYYKNTAATTVHPPNTPRKKSAHILCAMFFCPVKYNLSCSLILLPGTEFTIIPTGSLSLRNPTSLS